MTSSSRALALLASMPNIAYATGSDRRLTLANPRFVALLCSVADPIGRRLEDVLPLHLVAQTLEHERQVAAIDMPLSRLLPVEGVSGARRTWLVTKFPLPTDPGPAGIGTVVADVTDQVRERAVALEEASFVRQVLDLVPNLIYAKDRNQRFTLVNRAMAQLLDRPAEQVIGHTELELFVGAEDVEPTRRDVAALDEGIDRLTPEERRHDARGAERWFRTSRQPLSSSDGVPEQMLGVATEITDYRRAQHEQLRLKDERVEAIGRLAGGIAHDFNNLLTVLRSGADILDEAMPPGSELRFVAEDIAQAADRAAKLTQHLLAYGRRQLLRPEPLDLNEVVTELGSTIRPLVGDSITLELSLASDLPAVLADRTSMDQVLVNLASNARDAMPHGGTLRIQTATALELGSPSPSATFVELSVEDTGRGIAPEHLDNVFEPFFTTKPQGQGTGLGLSTVHGIVRQSGGDITVVSHAGQGARFIIRLPCSAAPVERPAAEHPATEGSGECILVVDDEAAIRRAARRILERHGYWVLLAEDLASAKEQATQHADVIELLLLDVVMPGASGFEVAQQLRPMVPSARVLHMTGHTKDTLPASAGVLADRYLRKPFTIDQLLERVGAALRGLPAGAVTPTKTEG